MNTGWYDDSVALLESTRQYHTEVNDAGHRKLVVSEKKHNLSLHTRLGAIDAQLPSRLSPHTEGLLSPQKFVTMKVHVVHCYYKRWL
jgi:hypothetical protein